ncbi:PilN domain-containing protein [Paenibacillus sp. TRM 82003]|nr:PilN domain-containing protein [Paenibacillus sp. TRM 82003]
MRTINLLPKKPFWTVWFVPMLGGLIFLYLSVGAVVLYGVWSSERQLAKNEVDIAQMEIRLETLREERVPDPMLAVFEGFKQTVALVDTARPNWFPLVEAISSELPEAARLNSLTKLQETGAIQLNAEFGELRDIADYIRNVRTSGLFRDIRIDSLTMSTAFIPDPVALPSEPQVGEATNEGNDEPEVGLTEWSDDPDIRELEWLIMRQAAEQGFGYDLQYEELERNEYPEWLLDSFSREELDSAKDAVERFKNQELDAEPNSNVVVNDSQGIAGTGDVVISSGTTLTYYSVSLSFFPIGAGEESQP